jgi:hypothetical protein
MLLDLEAMLKLKAPGLDDLQARLASEGLTLIEQHEALTEHQRLFEEAARKAAAEEMRLVERAVRTWADQCGVSVEEWAKYYGYRTERIFLAGEMGLPTESHEMQIAVHPVLLRDPPESWPMKPWY